MTGACHSPRLSQLSKGCKIDSGTGHIPRTQNRAEKYWRWLKHRHRVPNDIDASSQSVCHQWGL